VPSPVLKACLDDMALDGAEDGKVFADSDDEDEADAKKSKAVNKKRDTDDPYTGSLIFKSVKWSSGGLYYVDHSKLKNGGNGLSFDERSNLESESAQTVFEIQTLTTSLEALNGTVKKLRSEPTNLELVQLLESEEADCTALRENVIAARKLKVNEKLLQQTKIRIASMTAQWRKRRRLCMDFLISLEEITDGSITAKKCLSTGEPIEIDSDESASKAAVEMGVKKRARAASGSKTISAKRHKSDSHAESAESLGDDTLVAVILDGQGCVQRVHLPDEE
jgi:hypothetical protein